MLFALCQRMTTLLDVPLADGGSFIVEVDETHARPVTRSGRTTEAVVRGGQTFEQAIERLSPAFAVLFARLRDATERPDEIEIEFGLKLNTEVGAIVARTGAEANFRVVVRWSRG
jgi:hypothetical protein